MIAKTVKFVWDHKCPVRPHGEDVEVIFNRKKVKVIAANYLSNGYPLDQREVRRLTFDLLETIAEAKGVSKFLRRRVKVIPE